MKSEPVLLMDVFAALRREGLEPTLRRAPWGQAALVGYTAADAPRTLAFDTRLNLKPPPPAMEESGLALDMMCWPLFHAPGWFSSANRVGRVPHSEVAISHPDVSKHHAQIVIEEEGARLIDLGSANGTFINGTRVAVDAPAALKDWDTVHFGAVQLTFLRTGTLLRLLATDGLGVS